VFGEIEQRLELFKSENKELKEKQAKKFCYETENELLNIKIHLNKAFFTKTFTEKRKEIIEIFDRMIFLSRRKIDTIANNSLEQNINKLTVENEKFKTIRLNLKKAYKN